jgi:hypothetical protein
MDTEVGASRLHGRKVFRHIERMRTSELCTLRPKLHIPRLAGGAKKRGGITRRHGLAGLSLEDKDMHIPAGQEVHCVRGPETHLLTSTRDLLDLFRLTSLIALLVIGQHKPRSGSDDWILGINRPGKKVLLFGGSRRPRGIAVLVHGDGDGASFLVTGSMSKERAGAASTGRGTRRQGDQGNRHECRARSSFHGFVIAQGHEGCSNAKHAELDSPNVAVAVTVWRPGHLRPGPVKRP